MRPRWSRRSEPAVQRLVCDRCATLYRPALTRGDCPVCGLVGDARLHPADTDPESRPVALAVAAMAANLVIFGLVVWAVLG